MNNALMVTVVGWAASTPREVVGGDRAPYTSFRLATTSRYFDARLGTWADGRTEWFTVKAFRDVAFNVAASVRKGDPLVVHGRMRSEEWAGEQGPRTTLVLEASALGHDLTRGTARFARTIRTADAAPGEDRGGDAVVQQADGAAAGDAVGEAPPADPWATDAAVVPADAEPVDLEPADLEPVDLEPVGARGR
ncbi:single-stranded DNA-binding protein [Actinotalea sp.]|uniref:single-stranded DNA-binding protein n=1 Tax=Actinotalea sp. TaxID=1872145 RepID=UPI002B8E1F91|nr:single-stranded DNA-binding protein [Actinotalea sp.]HRA49397.1 single-stranded DNA-binding protein [Actinotalea sp.]